MIPRWLMCGALVALPVTVVAQTTITTVTVQDLASDGSVLTTQDYPMPPACNFLWAEVIVPPIVLNSRLMYFKQIGDAVHACQLDTTAQTAQHADTPNPIVSRIRFTYSDGQVGPWSDPGNTWFKGALPVPMSKPEAPKRVP